MSRIAPLEPPYEPEIQQQFDLRMRGAPPLMLFRVVASNARAWGKFRAGSLLDRVPLSERERSPLSLREREIIIDRTCALTRCEYEWGVHISAFGKAAELTEAQIRATVLEGAEASCWSAPEHVLIATVDALHLRATLSEGEFRALSAHYDDAKIFEIILLCGFYRTVSYLANGLDLRLEKTAARFPS